MTKYSFFGFETNSKAASNRGHVRGMVDNETGAITAAQSFGAMIYREEYKMNANDDVNAFPHTLQDRIIMAARSAAERS